MTEICYKMWQVLQRVTVITKCDRKLFQSITGITKCDSYYKVRRNSSNKHTWWERKLVGICICQHTVIKPLPWDHVIEAQTFSTDPWWWLHHQLLANLMVRWSIIMPLLDVRQHLELEINPYMMARQPSTHKVTVICNLRLVHIGQPASQFLWLLYGL